MDTLCTSASCLDKQKILNDRNNYLQVSFNELKNQVGNKSYVLDSFRLPIVFRIKNSSRMFLPLPYPFET